jgi:hypothetical protein
MINFFKNINLKSTILLQIYDLFQIYFKDK